MKLAVVTLTTGKSKWYSEMVQSVTANLPACGSHVIVKCNEPADVVSIKWDAQKLAEYVCFVDDDDIVLNNSIQHCLDALIQNPTAAVAFANERYISATGESMASPHDPNRRLSYSDVTVSAQTIHGMRVLRTSMLDHNAKTLHNRLQGGTEWLLYASSALKYGAVHVPIEGYAWRQYNQSLSKSVDWNHKFIKQKHIIRAYLQAQLIADAAIPTYTPTVTKD